ncbi:MAG: class I SAM-dependent methyltransferase [Alphaproteobacteria bacterium]|nr:class I SAM-dependent methyltransferase [Alphaproteobacteria bacterium]
MHKYYAQDLLIDLKLAAKREAIDYIQQHMADALMFKDRDALLAFAVRDTQVPGLILEFGVEKGASLRVLARQAAPRIVHGFDAFLGLPDHWTGTFEQRGKFSMSGKPPDVEANARLHVGWFNDTLPGFLAANAEPIAVLHVDCDIYPSTKTVFDQVGERLQPGATIVFDEYFNYPGWRQHEFKAFQEWIAASGRRYRYLGFATEKGHVAVRMM